jgi:hypothetical protein
MIKVGDLIEFLSDSQTDKGPSLGVVKAINGGKALINHSDTFELFVIKDLLISKKITHNRVGTFWQLK